MTQHTPGPWGICNNATPDRAPTEWVIGPMRGRNTITTVQSNGHDARLIAAAPELLGTLECATACLESTLKVLTGGAKEMIEMQIAQGHEAITKARGEVSQ